MYEDLPPPLTTTSFMAGDPNVATDAFGQVYVKQRLIGTVPLASDGSAHFTLGGGIPISLKLQNTTISTQNKYPRLQLEQMTFMPGETLNQSFQAQFFNGLCGQCHGAISGMPFDIQLQPDILTQASAVIAKGSTPTPLAQTLPAQRGTPIGPQ